jgi:tetratricopeptide (TPR) repeat protein
MNNLGRALEDTGKLDLALRLYEETLRLRKAKLGPDHPSTLTSANRLALGLRAAGKLDLALPLFEEAANGVAQRGYRPQNAGRIVNDLIGCQEQLKQFDQAAVWRRKWLAVVKAKDGLESAAYAEALTGLGVNLIQRQKHADAETILRESLAILQQKHPASRTIFDTQSLLGAALLGQQKYADAEPLLLQGYQRMKESEKELRNKHPGLPTKERVTEALERLVQLYDAWGKPDQAAKWRKELEKTKEQP